MFGATAKSTEDMRKADTYEGWNVQDAWIEGPKESDVWAPCSAGDEPPNSEFSYLLVDGVENTFDVTPRIDPTGTPTGIELTGMVDGWTFRSCSNPPMAQEATVRVGAPARNRASRKVRASQPGCKDSPPTPRRTCRSSQHRHLGTFATDGEGSLDVAIELLPDAILACQHTLQVVGTLSGGQQFAAHLGSWVLANPFPFADVDTTTIHAPAVGCLTDLGGVIGFTGGNYDQHLSTSRGQAATIVARLMNLEGVTPSFPDAGSAHGPTIGALEQ